LLQIMDIVLNGWQEGFSNRDHFIIKKLVAVKRIL
jgi:hypothetical protein